MRYFYLLIIVSVIFGCSEDDMESINQSKTWELTQYEFANGELLNKEDFVFFETIEMRSDSSFVKIRLREEEVISESTGRYIFDQKDDFIYVYLDHNADNDFIINCDGSLRETLRFEGEFLTNDSSPCDWPVLRFSEVK